MISMPSILAITEDASILSICTLGRIRITWMT